MDLINNQRCNYFPVTKSLVIHRPHKVTEEQEAKSESFLRNFTLKGLHRVFFFFLKSGEALLQNHGREWENWTCSVVPLQEEEAEKI